MIIHAIKDYSIVVELDIVQAASILQMLHLSLSMGLNEDVAINLSALGTEIEPDSVTMQVAQVIDSISRAIGMDVYEECECGDKHEEPDYEADPDAPKPAKETVH